MEALRRAVANKDEAGARRRSVAVADHADFATLDEPLRGVVLYIAALAAVDANDNPRALARLRQAVALPTAGDSFEPWLLRAEVAWWEENDEEAVEALTRVAERWPDHLGDLSTFAVNGIALSDAADKRKRLRLLQALSAADYRYRHLGSASPLWLALATLELEAGNRDGARAAVAKVDRTPEIVHLRSDRRYDGLFDRDDPQFDAARAAQREVDDHRANALLDGEVLELQVAMAFAQARLGEHENVIALVEQVDAEIAAGAEYAHADFWHPVARSVAAWSLLRLGRNDEAVKAMQAALALPGAGPGPHLDVGHLLVTVGKPRDALAHTDQADDLSDYGRMVQALVRLRAAVALDDATLRATNLAYLRDHRDDAPGALVGRLLVVGDIDAARDEVLAQLRDADRRTRMLADLQDLRDNRNLTLDPAVDARWQALRRDPRVLAAAAEVGHIESYPLHAID